MRPLLERLSVLTAHDDVIVRPKANTDEMDPPPGFKRWWNGQSVPTTSVHQPVTIILRDGALIEGAFLAPVAWQIRGHDDDIVFYHVWTQEEIDAELASQNMPGFLRKHLSKFAVASFVFGLAMVVVDLYVRAQG